MKTSRLELLRKVAAVSEDVTALDHEQLAETVRLSGTISHEALGEFTRRVNDAEVARVQAERERREQLRAEGEERQRARLAADAAAEVEAAERQRQRDDEEAEQARAMIRAAGLMPVPVFSHPR